MLKTLTASTEIKIICKFSLCLCLLSFVVITRLYALQLDESSDVHPQERYYPVVVKPKAFLEVDFPNPDIYSANVTSILDSLHFGYGVVEQHPSGHDYFFGKIGDVALHGSNIFVVDEISVNMKIIDLDSGTAIAIGGRGNGPGEFQAPLNVVPISGSTIAVLDKSQRVSFLTNEESGWKEERRFSLSFSPYNMCELDNTLVISGYVHGDQGKGNILHLYDYYGEHISSIGSGYHSDNVVLNNRLSESATVICDIRNKSVIYVFRYIPVVVAYNVSGDVLWEKVYGDFAPFVKRLHKNEATGSVGVLHESGSPGMHQTLGAIIIDKTNRVLIQKYEIPDKRSYSTVPLFESIIINATNGELLSTYISPEIKVSNEGIKIYNNRYPEPAITVMRR